MQEFHRFEEKIVRVYARDLFTALKSIHQESLVHGNIKPSNVLINYYTRRISLTDFFVFQPNKQSITLTHSLSSAPEILLHFTDCPTKASDVWSAGYALLQMYLGHSAWIRQDGAELKLEQAISYLKKNKSFKLPLFLDKQMQEFFESIFQINPDLRPSCHQLLDSPFIQYK